MLKQYWMKLKARLSRLMGFRDNKKDEIVKEILKLIRERKELRQNLEELQLQMKDIKDEAEDVYEEIKKIENAMELNERKVSELVEAIEKECDIESLYR